MIVAENPFSFHQVSRIGNLSGELAINFETIINSKRNKMSITPVYEATSYN